MRTVANHKMYIKPAAPAAERLFEWLAYSTTTSRFTPKSAAAAVIVRHKSRLDYVNL